MERSPSSVVVLKDCGNRTFRRVLVPVAGGPNASFALEVAGILAAEDDSEIVALHVTGAKSDFEIGQFISRHADGLAVPSDHVQAKVIPARDVTAAILREARDYDLVVLGWTRQPMMRRVAGSTLPLRLARRTDKPVVIVRASGGIRSWVRRWI